jgi:hypothetical protein
MSAAALWLMADGCRHGPVTDTVSKVPTADSCTAANSVFSIDNFVYLGQQCRRDRQTECFCCFHIDRYIKLCGLLHG